jgi:hypothetical protein
MISPTRTQSIRRCHSPTPRRIRTVPAFSDPWRTLVVLRDRRRFWCLSGRWGGCTSCSCAGAGAQRLVGVRWTPRGQAADTCRPPLGSPAAPTRPAATPSGLSPSTTSGISSTAHSSSIRIYETCTESVRCGCSLSIQSYKMSSIWTNVSSSSVEEGLKLIIRTYKTISCWVLPGPTLQLLSTEWYHVFSVIRKREKLSTGRFG